MKSRGRRIELVLGIGFPSYICAVLHPSGEAAANKWLSLSPTLAMLSFSILTGDYGPKGPGAVETCLGNDCLTIGPIWNWVLAILHPEARPICGSVKTEI